jgi:hypothetical protein
VIYLRLTSRIAVLIYTPVVVVLRTSSMFKPALTSVSYDFSLEASRIFDHDGNKAAMPQHN